MTELPCFPDFDSASRAVLALLRERLQFDLWMVTRAEGDDWIVLQSEDHGYGIAPERVFRWADSFCSRMVVGQGPRVAPKSADVPAYAEAPIGRQAPIGAYIGVPLSREDGSLFGTLCAVHPTPQPSWITDELPLVELMGRLLSTVLTLQLKACDELRRAERAEVQAETDALTGLYNLRGWERLSAAEEDRCRQFGHPLAVLSIDLDRLKQTNDQQGHAAGDELIRRAARAVSAPIRKQDAAARVGGDEFLVLCVECGEAGAEVIERRIADALQQARVEASMGRAVRRPGQSLAEALRLADEQMRQAKQNRAVERGS